MRKHQVMDNDKIACISMLTISSKSFQCFNITWFWVKDPTVALVWTWHSESADDVTGPTGTKANESNKFVSKLLEAFGATEIINEKREKEEMLSVKNKDQRKSPYNKIKMMANTFIDNIVQPWKKSQT